MEVIELMKQAEAAAAIAYAPYSHFRVGAALLCQDGSVITGCNVENRSFGLTICAERNAMAKAISLGKKEFKMLALYCADSEIPVPPCGACRQVLSEFVDEDFPIHFRGSDNRTEITTMSELLPFDSLKDFKER
jgi:cytidine deaminase